VGSEMCIRDSAEGKLLAVFNDVSPPHPSPSSFRPLPDVQNMTIGPRQLIASLGGWRDLSLYEDWDIWSRAGRANEYVWTTFVFASNKTVHPSSIPSSEWGAMRLSQRYVKYRDRLRLGLKVFVPKESVGLSQRLAYIAARGYILFNGTLIENPEFDTFDESLLIRLELNDGAAR